MQFRPLLRTTFAIAAFSFLGTAACIANNNLFLPGDAFFPTLLTKDSIASVCTTKSGARTFEYIATDVESGAMCGYAGYANATIPSVDDAFARGFVGVKPCLRFFFASPPIRLHWNSRFEVAVPRLKSYTLADQNAIVNRKQGLTPNVILTPNGIPVCLAF